MPLPYTEEPEDRFTYESDWLESIDNVDPSEVTLSNDVQEATMVGIVRANKMRACARWFLGFAYADTSDPWRLRRENPQWHPHYPQLRAYEINFKKFIPEANTDNENNSPYESIPFDPTYFVSKWKYMTVTVRFRNYIYRFYEDLEIDEPKAEYLRNCWVQTEPRIEALTISGGMSQLKFAETGPTGPSLKTPFPAPIAALLSKKGIVINWYDVPWEYLSDHHVIFTPTKLDAIVGKVNSDMFLNFFEPGTLLAEPYRYTISTWAVAPEDARDALRKVTLSIPFSFFDPEQGADAPVARGHNLMPWGGTGIGDHPGGDTKFYLATRNGEPDGTQLIPSAAFQSIFTHVSAL